MKMGLAVLFIFAWGVATGVGLVGLACQAHLVNVGVAS